MSSGITPTPEFLSWYRNLEIKKSQIPLSLQNRDTYRKQYQKEYNNNKHQRKGTIYQRLNNKAVLRKIRQGGNVCPHCEGTGFSM